MIGIAIKKQKTGSANDRVAKVLGPFENKAKNRILEVSKKLKDLKDVYKSAKKYFFAEKYTASDEFI